MIEEVAEIVIWTVLVLHVEAPMEEDGDVMTEEMIDLHQIEMVIGEKIEAEEGLMIVTVILSVVPLGEEEVKTAGVVRMIEMTEVQIVAIETDQCEEEEMTEVLAMIEAQEAMVVVLEAAMIVVHEVGMIVVVETTEVRLTGGPGLENLIEMKSLKWEIVIVVMTDEIVAMVEGIIGDLGLEWEIEIEEVLEIVVHQQMISPKGVNSQQMGMMENGKLSVNVNFIP